jgi:hypothetical protein
LIKQDRVSVSQDSLFGEIFIQRPAQPLHVSAGTVSSPGQ